MSHRGPDHQGTFVSDGIGLVHTRLSLVDLDKRSNQPFASADGRHVLVFNGEIYNFRELRETLETHGATLETTSDTEVLLQCLIHLGLDQTLEQIEGMFAFAWYDQAADQLTLARDRFGMKPLWYHDDGQSLFFSSEPRALRPWSALEPDPFSIAAFLQKGSPPTQGFTLYRGVRILAPGTTLIARRDREREHRRFFSLVSFRDEQKAEALARTPRSELVDRVDATLGRSVETQLAADVPIGAFCSGGVDSSVVMAMAARRHTNLAIFHANVTGRHSEYTAAAELADHLKLELLSVDVDDEDFLRQLPIVTRHFGLPISYRHDSIPLFMVSHLVHQHGVRGIISGEGADEIFLGYKWLMPRRLESLSRFKPHPFLFKNFVKRIVQGKYAPLDAPATRSHLMPDLLNRLEVSIEDHARRHTGPEKEVQSLKMLGYHMRTLLHRNDTIGMSASIECRFPFLDRDLVSLAVNLPYRTKIRRSWRVRDWRHPFLQNKWILREVAKRYMPNSLSLRPKRPFPTNAFERMQITQKFLNGSPVVDLLELSQREIDFLVDEGSQDVLLRLLHLNVWFSVCLLNEDVDQVAEQLLGAISITPDRWQPN